MTQMDAITTLSGLVGYWPCDEATGATVHDVSATPAHGSLSGAGAILAPWNSPGGIGAVGLRPTTATLASTAALAIPSASKLNVGDSFSVGLFFRRRAAVDGSLYTRSAAPGSELLSNRDFEGSTLGAWNVPVGTVTLDSSVSHTGSKSAKISVNASADNVGINQYAYGGGAATQGRYTMTFWYKNDSNSAGRLGIRVTYTDGSSATKVLQANDGVFSTTSTAITVPYSATWTQYTMRFTLAESATLLNVAFARLYGAGGGVAYSMWVDDASLTCQAAVGSGGALRLAADGTVTFSVSDTTVATSNVLIDDYLHWHYLVCTKSGATTTLYLDGVDVTVAGTDATVSTTGLDIDFFSGGIGLQPVVAAHLFLVNRAISGAEQLAIYRAANMLPDKAEPRSLKRMRLGYSGESTNHSVVPAWYSAPEAIAAAARKTHSTWMREIFDWWQVEQTQGVRVWTPLDQVVDAHSAHGLNVLACFDFHSPGWAINGTALTSGNPLTQTVPGSATKGISVAEADTDATNGGYGDGAYSTWRDRFISFIVAAVHRYKHRIFQWELGNETNTSYFAGPAASAPLFVDFYNRCRAAILDELGSDAWRHQIAMGGLCRYRSELGTTDSDSYLADEYLRAVLDLGIADFDRIGLHPYLSSNADPAVHTPNGLNLDGMHQMRDTLMEYGRTPVLEIGEMGWSTEDTTIASASDGVTLPHSSITVVDASLLPYGASGTVYVETSLGFQPVTYTGKSGNTLTGCTGGTGVISTGGLVAGATDRPASEAAAAGYLVRCLELMRDCLSGFCDTFFWHTISGPFGGAGALLAYRDVALLKPKPMVARYAAFAALYDPREARPVQTPLVGAPTLTAAINPSLGVINSYDATDGPLSVDLPPAATTDVGARLIVGKCDDTSNTVTVNCDGVDTFLDGSASTSLAVGMQREIQLISIAGVKVWAFLGSSPPLPPLIVDHFDGTATVTLGS